MDENGADQFSFPEGIPNVQKFKQFGNSVTIPVIEEYAIFIQKCCDIMYSSFSEIEKRIFSMYGNEFLLCSQINKELSCHLRTETLNRYFDIVYHYKSNRFRVKELASYLNMSAARASQDHFYYGEKFLIKEPDDGEGRLMKPFNTSRNDPAFDTMTSMRNVDSTVAGKVLIWEEE